MGLFLKIIFIFFLFICTLNGSDKRLFTVSYDPDYAPFSYLENNKPEGLLIDYWNLWAQKSNYKIKYVNAKLWDNAIDLARSGKVDFFLGTNPYEDWMKSSYSIYKTKTSFFVHKTLDKNISKQASYLIGIVGENHKEYISKIFPFSQIIIYKDYPSLFKDFLTTKLDLIFDDKLAIDFYSLKSNFFHKIKPINLPHDYISIKAISKDKDLIDIFNKGFRKLTNEELYEVESKWVLNSNQQIYKKSFTLNKEEKEFLKNHPLKVSVSEDWKPFIFKDQKGEPAGMAYDIWEIMARGSNINPEYIFSNTFTKQLNLIKNKEADLIFSAGETKDRLKYSIFTKPYIEFPLSIATLKDENFIESIDYLYGKKIAVGKNFTSHKIIEEHYPDLKLITVDNIEDGLNMVNSSQIYAFIDIKPNLIYNINKLKLNNLKISGNTGLYYKVAIMIRDDYPILQNILNKVISSLDQNEISQISGKWSNIQYTDSIDYTIFWLIISISFIVFVILIYINQLNMNRNKTLKLLVDEQTKDLKQLNQELEKRVEIKTKELSRTNYLLDEAQKIARLGSFSYNLRTKNLEWSDEHYKIFGLYAKEIKPSVIKFLSFVHEEEKRKIKKHLYKAIKSDKRKVIEFRIKLKDNTLKYIQLTTKVTKFDTNNKPTFVVGTVFDLTKIKQLEFQKREKDSMLAQQSKMAALGEMLENIAHQWRQPLSVISTASTGLQIQLEMGNEISNKMLYNSVKSINEHSQYLSKTIDDFRNFFNPRKDKKSFFIDSTIEKSLSLVSSRIKRSNIEIIREFKSVKIKTIESELIQILLNLFNNAIDALDSNKLEKKFIFISTIKKDNYLHIKVKDNAKGIDDKIIDKILEPYFTTKHKSQGTGIGLYMSNEIVTKHLNGRIDVANTSYTYNNIKCFGALFTISIPLEKV